MAKRGVDLEAAVQMCTRAHTQSNFLQPTLSVRGTLWLARQGKRPKKSNPVGAKRRLPYFYDKARNHSITAKHPGRASSQ